MPELEDEKHSTESLLGEPEPWESWESKLIAACLITAIIGLVLLGWLIHTFILN